MEPSPPGPVVGLSPPSASLRPFVRAYVEQALAIPPGEELRVVQCANTEPVACVTWGDGAVHIGLGAGFPLPPLALAGPIPAAFTNVFTGSVRGFFVRFAPAGPLALLSVDGRAYAASPRFDDLVPPALADTVRRWGAAVIAAPDFGSRVALTERLLLDRLAHVDPRAAFVERIAARIEATSGRIRVDTLAAELGVGASTLRRRLRADLGIAAKVFSSIVRFRHTHAYLHTTPTATWADAVLRFGYADQSHFIRDYGRFAGVSPTQWSPELRHIDLNFGIQEGGRYAGRPAGNDGR